MSKVKLKRLLLAMGKDQIVELVLSLYDARKEAKEYLDFFVSPNEDEKLWEYKMLIQNEFYPKGQKEPQTRFSVCRKAISDFKKLEPSPKSLADLMMFYMETTCRFTYDYGDMWEQYYTSVEKNFKKTLQFIMANGLLDLFHGRIMQCLDWTAGTGWGFHDTLWIYYSEIIVSKP